MRIAIVGSRDFHDYKSMKIFIFDKIKLHQIETIVSGGASGADTLAEKFAKEFNLKLEVYKANWELYGKKAGFVRNKDIVKNSEVIFAFWDGKSKGTENTIYLAEKSKKQVFVMEFKNE